VGRKVASRRWNWRTKKGRRKEREDFDKSSQGKNRGFKPY
jgi:hypothetical protein